ncbi:MAG: hypothetical protein LBK98_08510 [Peptococcaceae bacterium]|jgi:hypothetical protein|nr:hypothetical protein [Peptococcaceae bacterium]
MGGDRDGGGFWLGQSGEGLISGFYVMFVLAIVLFLAVEVASYSMCGWKLYGACGEIMDLMKAENGLDDVMEQRFRILLRSLSLDDMEISLEGTPKTAQRGDLLVLAARGRYPVRCLRPFGREITVPFGARLNGLAHSYIRGI